MSIMVLCILFYLIMYFLKFLALMRFSSRRNCMQSLQLAYLRHNANLLAFQ